MPDLSFQVDSALTDLRAASPHLTFGLRIANADPDERIESVVLRCQIQIEATRRRYSEDEQSRLVDLFGEPDRWSKTLNRMLWTHAATVVCPFVGETTVDLPVPCTFDFNVAATKYFAGLDDGETPLLLQFSGTIFYVSDAGLQVAIIPWDREARFRLPVATWRQMMDAYYPNSAWLRLRKDAFDRLHEFKLRGGLATWEQAIDRLLATQPAVDSSHGVNTLRERLTIAAK